MSDEPNEPASKAPTPIDYATPAQKCASIFAHPAVRKLGRGLKTAGKWAGRVLLVLVIAFGLAIGFGTSPADAEKTRVFSREVDTWQHNPDFRRVQVQYVEDGSDAMRTKVCWVPTTKGIMWLRSLPGLPDHLKVSETSLAHYRDFTKGPLSAYMHLTGEQGLENTLNMIQYIGGKEKVSDQDIKGLLDSYKLHTPVVDDAGAIASVRSLFNDVDPGRGFTIRDDMSGRLTPHIVEVARELGYPTELNAMNPTEQLEVWQKLDSQVRETDYELWRTKQVNDWLNGVWAQVYGTMYSGLINPTLLLRSIGQFAGPMLLMGWIGLAVWKKKRAAEVVEGAGGMQPSVG